METLEAIRTRKSVRAFLDKPIPEEVIQKILEAGIQAPTGGNSQPWRFIAVTDREKIAQFDPEFHQPWVENAPAVIVACVNPHDTWESYDEDEHFYLYDVAAAIENMLLAIHDMGLGGVWVLSCSKRKIRQLLDIPLFWQIVSIVAFGYYDAKRAKGKRKSKKKPLSEVAFYNSVKTPFQPYRFEKPLDRPGFKGP